MWTGQREDIGGGSRYRILGDDGTMSFRAVFEALSGDQRFAAWYARLLADAPFEAFFWEHPPLTADTMGADAEFVLLRAPALAGIRENPRPFRAHFDAAQGAATVVFGNLGGDATLVAPAPVEPRRCCAHMAAFLREAPDGAVLDLLRVAARTVMDSVGRQPLWVSTSGLGVAWLHVRLDSFPKYYQHQPYRRALS